MSSKILTAERLRELLSYDPETGDLMWIIKNSFRIKVGDVAGYKDYRGCLLVRIDRRIYRAHRLAWLWTHGRWPTDEIDHIDGNPSNNRMCNLREATHALNMQNRRRATFDNKSGFLGVSWREDRKTWVARIQINGKKAHLGHFSTAEEAHNEYLRAKHKHHEFGTLEHPGGEMRDPDRVTASLALWRKPCRFPD